MWIGTDREHIGRGVRGGTHASQDRADPQHQLLRAEGLREVVIGAEREAADAIRLFAARGEHEYRDIARGVVTAQLLEHVEPGQPGEHQVEDDDRGAFLPRETECVLAVRGGGDAVAGFREVVRDEGDNVRLIVDDKDALRVHRCNNRLSGGVSRRSHDASGHNGKYAAGRPVGQSGGRSAVTVV